MLLRIASFELRQQLLSQTFWIVFTISMLMVAGALWVPELRVGLGATDPANGAQLIARTHLIWSLFYMFTAAAFAADAVLRDELTNFAPIIAATPVPRRSYVVGRFLGGYGATAICFLSVPAALLAAALASGSNVQTTLIHIAEAVLVLAIPNLFTSAAFFFVLATALRSMLGVLIGAVALLGLYGFGLEGSGPYWTLAEPFGFAASMMPEPGRGQALLLNRVLWIGISLFALGSLFLRPPRARRHRPATASTPDEVITPPRAAPLPLPRHDRFTALRQFLARIRFESRQLLLNPSFAVLMMLGLGNAAATLWRLLLHDPGAGPADIVIALIDAFDLVPIVVAVFFAGELVWSEHDHRVQELIGASPVPGLALLLPKLAALGLALAGLAFASAAAAVSVPVLFGRVGPGAGQLLAWYIVPRSFDWLLIAVLALFLQIIAPNKLAGWGLMVLYLVGSLALEQMGLTNPIYRFGSYPAYPLSPALSGAEGVPLYLSYWAAFAILLLA
jgi:ABC-type transport system involved in multi-copper enzyme maturation permease subunit